MNWTRSRLFGGLFVLAAVSLVFSFEVPIESIGSNYASINSIDFIILIITLGAIIDNYIREDWEFNLILPQVTAFFAIVSGWIIITLVVASIRSPVSILASVLWTLKWFEVLLLFILAQNYLNSKTGAWVIAGFFVTGTCLAIISILTFQLLNIHRIRIFFGNPNTLSGFYNLIILVGLGFTFQKDRSFRILSFGAVLLAGYALLLAGSRSGILGLIVGVFVFILLSWRRLFQYGFKSLVFGGVGSMLVIPLVVPDRLWMRLTGWIQYKNGTLSLTNSTAARSFRIRLELFDKAIELFHQQPIFGYGWYASPSRVGFLDIHFTTLLVELGLIGFLLMMMLYLVMFRAWLDIQQNDLVGAAGAAWFISILVQSIGGNFPRTPQITFILLIFLSAGTAITQGRYCNKPSKGGDPV